MTLTKAGAATLAAIALVTCGRSAYQSGHAGFDSLRAPPRSPTERELASVPGIPTTYLVLARQTLPRDATFSVAVGDHPETSDLEELAIVRFLPYWLAPRRYTPDHASADWILTFHESSEALGVPVAEEIGLGPDGNAVRVGR